MGVGARLYMYVVVVQKFTFAISSPDEFLLNLTVKTALKSIAFLTKLQTKISWLFLWPTVYISLDVPKRNLSYVM